jgi:hypothetical protein
MLVGLHEVVGPGDSNWRLVLVLATSLFAYSFVSWALLYLFFGRAGPVNLGTVFLALDVFAFLWAIYLTGGDQSWLFFILFIRVADQANTSFRRALIFSHITVAGYAMLLLYLAWVEQQIEAPGGVQAADPHGANLRLVYGADLAECAAACGRSARTRVVVGFRNSRKMDEARRKPKESIGASFRHRAMIRTPERHPATGLLLDGSPTSDTRLPLLVQTSAESLLHTTSPTPEDEAGR